ncbi:uncharacterized protein LOC126902719 [Daktulosphaira vitifoliae]|uniref:uncharacterized protein LOC126902719 n=1 Tax=Daktulosphaira vitifoliae TaxID=58002 RepID=UPI0021AAB5FF|nr:uncharacterized protein LOC126902719 [Daktulosphaira vitifoliae]
MELINSYVVASRLVLQADSTDPVSWQELHTLLLYLHDNLLCQVCEKLIDDSYSHPKGLICKSCAKNLKIEQPTWSIIQFYKKLCSYIHKSPLFNAMCIRIEDNCLVELIIKVLGLPKTTNHNGWISNENFEGLEKHINNDLHLPSDVQLSVDDSRKNGILNLQILSDVRTKNDRIQVQQIQNIIPKKKKTTRRWGCRCGNATTTPGKLTCFGQRCPCYIEQKSCDMCKCRGCRNPRPKPTNDDNKEVDKIRRKPVTLELVSSLKPSHIKSKTTYTMSEILQFPTHSKHFEQDTEVTLGRVNSIFHSP